MITGTCAEPALVSVLVQEIEACRVAMATEPHDSPRYRQLQLRNKSLRTRLWQSQHREHIRAYQRQRRISLSVICEYDRANGHSTVSLLQEQILALRSAQCAMRIADLRVEIRGGCIYRLCPRCDALTTPPPDGRQCTCCGRIAYDLDGEVDR